MKTLILALFATILLTSPKSSEAAETWHHYWVTNAQKTGPSPSLPSDVSFRIAFRAFGMAPTIGLEQGATYAQPVYFEVRGLGPACGRAVVSVDGNRGGLESRVVVKLRWSEQDKLCYGEYSTGTYIDMGRELDHKPVRDARLFLSRGREIRTQNVMLDWDRRSWSFDVRLGDAAR